MPMKSVAQYMTGRDRDEDTGQFSEEYPSDVFVDALRDIGPAGTTDVADHIGCDRRTAYVRLNEIKKETELIKSEKVGNALLWSIDSD